MGQESLISALRCVVCLRVAAPTDWRCAICGSCLEFVPTRFDPDLIKHEHSSLLRYREMLPSFTLSLGEGGTPLQDVAFGNLRFQAKLEFVSPTGSYKDRGAAVMLSHLARSGVTAIADDSSGNAGIALAAYARAFNIEATLFVPAHAPIYKKQRITELGGRLVEIDGTREDARDACLSQLGDRVYASHAWSPLFLSGQMTCAWELWEQLRRRPPRAIVCPVGEGGLLLGLMRGYAALLAAGLIECLPRLFAVQSAACDPVVRAFERGMAEVAPAAEGATLADGIRIRAPVRGRELLAALRSSRGGALRVDESSIRVAAQALWDQGLPVEPTSAVAVAGLEQILPELTADERDCVVVPLTGVVCRSADRIASAR